MRFWQALVCWKGGTASEPDTIVRGDHTWQTAVFNMFDWVKDMLTLKAKTEKLMLVNIWKN